MLFDYLDLKGNKHLDYTEFKLGLNKLDIAFRDNECFNLFRRYSNDDGSISANEFHDMLVGWMD
jgi:Ca2+-binding EF-hand superfamily protein